LATAIKANSTLDSEFCDMENLKISNFYWTQHFARNCSHIMLKNGIFNLENFTD